MQTLWQDLRYALRQLRHSPGFAITAIVTLALGIGATIGVYTLVDAILLRPLPYGDPARLNELEASKDGQPSWINYANLLELTRHSEGKFTSAAVVREWSGKMDAAERRIPVRVVETTSNLPAVLGVEPVLGRSFAADENQPGKNRVLLLSHEIWRDTYAADPQVVGKTAVLLGQAYTVIGVMPPTFEMPMETRAEVWVPAAISPAELVSMSTEDGLRIPSAILRASAGITPQQLSSELATFQKSIVAEHHDANLPPVWKTTPYLTSLNQSVRRPLLLLLGVGASFWLLAAMNVVGLLIARATAREREFAVRSALGATRSRLLRQPLVESLVLSAAGSLLGLLLATFSIKLLWHAIALYLPLTQRIHIEGHVEIALVAVTVITGFVVGLLPAMRAGGSNVQNGLRGGASPLPRAEQHRLRSALIVVQLMITVVLLAEAGLFLRTVTALRHVPLGFSEQNVLTGGIIVRPMLPSAEAPAKQSDITGQFYLPLLQKLTHMPGVESAAMSSVLPMRTEFRVTMTGSLDGKDSKFNSYPADGRVASPGLPETFGIPMVRGRFFTEDDTATSPRVVVVNEAFVKAYLKGTDPLEHTFGLGDGAVAAMRIVGVLADVKQSDVTIATKPEVYLCLAQIRPGDSFYGIVSAFMQVGIRARIPAQLLRKQFEVALEHVDPDAQSIDVKTIHEAVEDSFGAQTMIAHLLEGFSSLALLIAAVGLYGTVAFSVAQRTREFGVRLALGSPQTDILRLVLAKAMGPVIVGLVAGDIVLWFAARVLRGYLFGIAPHDSATFVVASCSLLIVASLAAFIPARRAAFIDPMQALRTE